MLSEHATYVRLNLVGRFLFVRPANPPAHQPAVPYFALALEVHTQGAIGGFSLDSQDTFEILVKSGPLADLAHQTFSLGDWVEIGAMATISRYLVATPNDPQSIISVPKFYAYQLKRFSEGNAS